MLEVERGGDALELEVRGSFHSGCEADLELKGCAELSSPQRNVPDCGKEASVG